MIDKVLKTVIKANLKMSVNECVFGGESIKFLGHGISQHGIRQDPDELKALTRLPEPRDVKEVKKALGMFSCYRRFVPNLALIVEPLTNLTRKVVEFKWEKQEPEAFKTQ